VFSRECIAKIASERENAIAGLASDNGVSIMPASRLTD